MKKLLLPALTLLSTVLFSQEHWEDNFWRKQTQERYKKTFNMKGLYTEFYDNGQIKWQGKCSETGTPDSTWVYYDDNGYKIWEGQYTGKYIEYKREYNDDYDEEGNYVDGQHNRDKNNRHIQDTTIIGNYVNGLKEGDWFQYDYEGKFIQYKGQYLHGEPTGKWQQFISVPVITKVEKIGEYDYRTQTQTVYNDDSIIKTEHLDSLTHIPDINQRVNYATTEGDNVRVNICAAGTAQMIDLNRLNNFFFQPGHSKIEGPVQSYGIEWSGTVEHFYWAYDIKWTPAVSAQLNDSIRLRLSGWNTAFHWGGDLIKSDHVDLAPIGGFGFQQLKLKTLRIAGADTSGYSFREGDFRVYKRSAFTADFALCLRFNMGYASIALQGGYLFDLSPQRWRYNGKYLDESPRTSLSGPFAGISFGIHIPDY
ncbi:MAG: toxin-antitoxin system YwqK family antitoxin [Bacteroidia bacterium]